MKFLIFALLAVGSLAAAEHRTKRQQEYSFPGPREQRSYSAEPVSRQDTYRSAQPRSYSQDDGEYQGQRRQFQAPPAQQYAPAPRPAPRPQQYSAPPPPRPAPRSYSAPEEAPPPRHKPAASARRPSDRPPSQQLEEYPEEEEPGPDKLTLLLQDSKFSCSGKTDGYYADNSIGCQVFHYCVGGARHSWMCPEGTRFHQVHLNCVPSSQDICGQSEKFHFVNDYLHKPYEGPNNTVLYHQKYYPEGYSIGDPLVAPEPRKQERRYQAEQNYAPEPAQPQPASRPAAPPQPPPQQYRPASPPAPAYRPAPPPAPAYRPAPPPAPAYRPAPPPRAPAPVYHPAPPSRSPPPSYGPPPQPAAPPRHVPRSRPSRPTYDDPPVFRSRPSGGSDYSEAPRYQLAGPPSRPPPPPSRSQQSSRYAPSQQQYGRLGNSPRVQYDDEY